MMLKFWNHESAWAHLIFGIDVFWCYFWMFYIFNPKTQTNALRSHSKCLYKTENSLAKILPNKKSDIPYKKS